MKFTEPRLKEQEEPGWWVEIITAKPWCTYYFGPFVSQVEAQLAQAGYLEDIEHEGAREIRVQVKWCQPEQLTVVN